MSDLEDAELYNRLYGSMPAYRRSKIDGYLFMKDKRLSMGVELLVRRAVRDFCDHPESVSLSYDANGKPFLLNSDMFINLSHSGERAMCSVSDGEVGCDVESVQDIGMDVARECFFGSEYDDVVSSDTSCRNEMFFRYWTLKESFMKATGLGMSIPLDSFRVILGETVKVEHDVNPFTYHFKEYDLRDGYRYAVCSLSDDFEESMRRVHLQDMLGC